MAEKGKADIYIAYLDQILAGKKDIGPVEDVELEKLLRLAKNMIATDFSVNRKMREKLKKKLLAQVIKESSLSVLSRNDDELDEKAYKQVAAGFAGQVGEQKDVCPYCGSRSKMFAGKCALCNY